MSSDNETLIKLASEMFTEDMAQAIGMEVETGLESVLVTEDRGGVRDKSVTTLFLADLFYSKLKTGKFSGRVQLIWDKPDSFVYLPDPAAPFSYVSSSGRTITPRAMYTDGGSIPRILRGFKRFSSWCYTPAFIVHDWLFDAWKHKHDPDANWSFEETASIMAEAMKTLMENGYTNFKNETASLQKSEDVLFLMYLAVRSVFAKKVWDTFDPEDCLKCPSTTKA